MSSCRPIGTRWNASVPLKDRPTENGITLPAAGAAESPAGPSSGIMEQPLDAHSGVSRGTEPPFQPMWVSAGNPRESATSTTTRAAPQSTTAPGASLRSSAGTTSVPLIWTAAV